MKLKGKVCAWMLLFALTASVAAGWNNQSVARAAAGASGIVEVIDSATMLMEDGSLWTNTINGPVQTTKFNLIDVDTDVDHDKTGYGLTSDGRMVSWNDNRLPQYEDDVKDLVQISGPYGLGRDGSIWIGSMEFDPLAHATLLGQYHTEDNNVDSTPYLLENGELWSPAEPNFKFTTFQDTSTVKMLAGDKSSIFALNEAGEVTRYTPEHMKDEPELVAENAVQTAIVPKSKKSLLIVFQDGTVSEYDYLTKYSPDLRKIEGLSGVKKISGVRSAQHFFVQWNDNTWSEFNGKSLTPVQTPGPVKAFFNLDDSSTTVGGTIKAKTSVEYSTGLVVNIPLAKADIEIEKPYLLKKQDNGTFKGLAVGETKVTFEFGDLSPSVNVTISLDTPILGGRQVKGVALLPLKPVFQALGATVSVNGSTKTFDIALGGKKIILTTGSSKATVDNKTVEMGAVVQSAGGQMLFPAKLLASALGAKLEWNKEWQYMDVYMGKANLQVYTDRTLELAKSAEQGTLAKLIGKTYWVNRYDDWERFSKLTIVDILPDYEGYFAILFRTSTGRTLQIGYVTRASVTLLLNDRSIFLNYDPYKKYNWSSAIWKSIKAEKVSIGMTKEQVRMSWGEPSGNSTVSGGGYVVETWSFSQYKYVTFTNGKVSGIYQY